MGFFEIIHQNSKLAVANVNNQSKTLVVNVYMQTAKILYCSNIHHILLYSHLLLAQNYFKARNVHN